MLAEKVTMMSASWSKIVRVGRWTVDGAPRIERVDDGTYRSLSRGRR